MDWQPDQLVCHTVKASTPDKIWIRELLKLDIYARPDSTKLCVDEDAVIFWEWHKSFQEICQID